jgi:hypothetical protein
MHRQDRSAALRVNAKVADFSEATRFEQLPNVGPATAGDLRLLGLSHPRDLRGKDPLHLYRELERLTASRQDPCVLDVFIGLTRQAAGDPLLPWWRYTAERKALYGNARGSSDSTAGER